MKNIKSVILIVNNEIDTFINRKVLERYDITDIVSFNSASNALSHLNETEVIYQLILTDIYLPLMDGFEFADKFVQLELNKKHGELFFLSASLNPLDKEKAKQRNIRFIEKPFKVNNLFPKI